MNQTATDPPRRATRDRRHAARPLRRAQARVKDAGLLEPRPPASSWARWRSTLSCSPVGVGVLFATDLWWVQLLNAAFLAFVFGQFGFVAHDAGHRQAFATPRQNDVVGLIHTTC
jgi:fatty acid desaturase